MAATRTPADSMALMARETRWHYGPVPRELGGFRVAPGFRMIADGCFLMRCESGFGYYYKPGSGITIEKPDDADPDEEYLWLNGSVYAAIASLNGLYPVHASAVAHNGRVVAFTGPGGAGKSTLVTALGQRGLPMFCDDTLLLDLSNPDRPIALPGHKRLKLTEHGLSLTGTLPEQPVGADTGKSYARPPGGDWRDPLPLAMLVFLEEGPLLAWTPVCGIDRFRLLDDDHHTQGLFLDAQRPPRAVLFALRARLAQQIGMAKLVRPRREADFAASVDLALDRILHLENSP
jgi:hypothetical protein